MFPFGKRSGDMFEKSPPPLKMGFDFLRVGLFSSRIKNSSNRKGGPLRFGLKIGRRRRPKILVKIPPLENQGRSFQGEWISTKVSHDTSVSEGCDSLGYFDKS